MIPEEKRGPALPQPFPLRKEEAAALVQFVAPCCLPILDQASPTIFGTGTLFAIKDRHFIITAAHVAVACPVAKWAYPPNRLASGSCPLTGDHRVITPLPPFDEVMDVTVVEMQSDRTVAELKRGGWRFLSLENVDLGPTAEWYFISGYPAALAKEMKRAVGGTLMTAFVRPIAVPPYAEGPVTEGVDIFFEHSLEGTSWDGSQVNAPELGGVSGGSVWRYHDDRSSIWSPQRVAKVIGIQSAARHGEYARVKSWRAVAEGLKGVDGLRDHIDQWLSSSVRS